MGLSIRFAQNAGSRTSGSEFMELSCLFVFIRGSNFSFQLFSFSAFPQLGFPHPVEPVGLRWILIGEIHRAVAGGGHGGDGHPTVFRQVR